MSLETNLVNLTVRIGQEFKSVREEIPSAPNVMIDDETAGTGKVFSSQKTTELVDAKIADLVGGAPEQFDTLKEIADKLGEDTVAEAVTAKLASIGDTEHDFVTDFQNALTGDAS